jgi:hypothetical protein
MGNTVSKHMDNTDQAKKINVLWQVFRVSLPRAFHQDLPPVPLLCLPRVWAYSVDAM